MTARVRVKICGITNPDDARLAIDAGADALGFNLWPGSKRHLLLDENAGWMTLLPPFVTRVAVLVNATFEEARRVAEHPAIDLVQFHGDESLDYLRKFAELGHPFIVAIRLANAAQAAQAHDLPTRHLLIDAEVPGSYGGTGKMIDFPLARAFLTQNDRASVILAGGLTPENVATAIAEVRPFAVDVASGVEASPGRKDPEKMRAFVTAIREKG
jgi:phosphoribosylanthranilate isomerase